MPLICDLGSTVPVPRTFTARSSRRPILESAKCHYQRAAFADQDIAYDKSGIQLNITF